GQAAPARLTLGADALRLAPFSASARLSLTDFDVTSAVPYLPSTLPAVPSRGRLGMTLDAQVGPAQDGRLPATASGRLALTDVAATRRNAPAPFLSGSRVAVDVTRADLAPRDVVIGRVDVTGLATTATR